MEFKRWWIAAAVATAVCGAGGTRAASAAGAVQNVNVVRIGTLDLSSVQVRENSAATLDRLAPEASPARTIIRMHAVNRRLPGTIASETTQTLLPPLPVVASLSLANGNLPSYSNFAGLGALASDTVNPAADLGIEPPDQGLCVGDGPVVEMVNLALATYDTSGNPQSSVIDLNTLFGVSPADFLSDPRCYYDEPSKTFFLTATDLGASDPGNKIWASTSWLLVGVMPAGGSTITTYKVDSTDMANSLCPCFEDQPLLGADEYGIYISGNEFRLSSASLTDGARIFAINKSDLIAGGAADAAVFASYTSYSVQPAVPAQGVFDTSNNGTEYLMSSLDFSGTRDNRIALWAITNTCGIPSASGGAACNLSPQVSATIITTMAYGLPPQARQKKGVFPVGQWARNRFETIDTGDDRMQQVVFAGGKLYAGLTTLLKVGRRLHTGILYFIIQPSVNAGVPAANSITANYVALAGADLYYPSIAANTNGSAVMAFSMSGARHFPSSAYMPLTGDLGAPAIYISQPGGAPYDGISGYHKYGGQLPARWGDYSAAFADDNGNLWMASEYAAPSCSKREWAGNPTCGGVRGAFANWATDIGEVMVP